MMIGQQTLRRHLKQRLPCIDVICSGMPIHGGRRT